MNSLKSSLLNVDSWIKILFIILFWCLLALVGLVISAVVLIQALMVLITGERNIQLLNFAENLSVYLKQIVDYICFVENDKPFPFADFPNDANNF